MKKNSFSEKRDTIMILNKFKPIVNKLIRHFLFILDMILLVDIDCILLWMYN